jgi:hypothetical protein
VKQLRSGRDGEEWYEWEERPGPGPPDDADRLSDELVIRVNYVEQKRPLGC